MKRALDLRDYSKMNYLGKTKQPPNLIKAVCVAFAIVMALLVLGMVAGALVDAGNRVGDRVEQLWK